MQISSELAELYQETILDHARRPHHKGALSQVDAAAEGKNPICGDEVAIQLRIDGDRVREAGFSGKGCALSQASASMLTDAVAGQSRDEVCQIIEAVERLVRGETTGTGELGDLQSLAGVSRVPIRIRCALLAWKVLRQALAG
jgi:nitrogen fixation protein NifU and related proteins